jgi:peptidoglycan/xylan/chitin deacetylase (PgdA/CDA1 family)
MHRFPYLILLWALAMVGCSSHFLPRSPEPATIDDKQFIIATVGPSDTLASLARTHLNDEGKAWQIASYNHIDIAVPGQQVVIPRIALKHGGIEQKGYQTIPVLLYPKLTNRPSKSKAVDASTFGSHLKYLYENEFTTVSLEQFNAFLALKDQLPPKAIVISFDTTQRWAYEIAFPLLRSRKMKASLFIRLKEIGAKGRLTWAQVLEMANNGIDIGVHGSGIEPSEKEDLKQYLENFEKEFTAPKNVFKTHLKKPCRYFSYAQGVSDDFTIAVLKKHGYRMAFTRKRGSNPFFIHNYKIRRSLIYGHYNMTQFRQNLITFKSAELR